MVKSAYKVLQVSVYNAQKYAKLVKKMDFARIVLIKIWQNYNNSRTTSFLQDSV